MSLAITYSSPMIDLLQWRASVGLFHAILSCSLPLRVSGDKNVGALLVDGQNVDYFPSKTSLLLAGDIELNPGPPKMSRKYVRSYSLDFVTMAATCMGMCQDELA